MLAGMNIHIKGMVALITVNMWYLVKLRLKLTMTVSPVITFPTIERAGKPHIVILDTETAFFSVLTVIIKNTLISIWYMVLGTALRHALVVNKLGCPEYHHHHHHHHHHLPIFVVHQNWELLRLAEILIVCSYRFMESQITDRDKLGWLVFEIHFWWGIR